MIDVDAKRAELKAECSRLGVTIIPQSESCRMKTIGLGARLIGRKNFKRQTWLTLDPYIHHPDRITDPFASVETLCTVEHELAHIRQQRGKNLTWWVAKYSASKQFRWEMEREGWLVDVRYGYPSHGAATILRLRYGITHISINEMVAWFNEQVGVVQ